MLKLKSKLIVVIMVMFGITVFMGCEKKDDTKLRNSDSYISEQLVENLEDLNAFYSEAIKQTKKNGKYKSSEDMFKEIEISVVKQCNEKLGSKFETEYKNLKELVESSKLKSTFSDSYVMSEYAKSLYFDIQYDIGNLFDDNSKPEYELMVNAISLKLNDYKELVAVDNNLTEEDKLYIINSIESQLIMLPMTFSLADLAFNNTNKSLKWGWFKRVWKKVVKFIGVVGEYALTASLFTKGNPIGVAAGIVIGIGAAIYCEKNGYNHGVCAPWQYLFSH